VHGRFTSGFTANVALHRPIYIIRLRALPGVDAVQALRAALKTLLRRYGLKCLSIEVETTNPQEAEDG
jgi:hypothetical protein